MHDGMPKRRNSPAGSEKFRASSRCLDSGQSDGVDDVVNQCASG
jgi:hypothetical protein